VESFRSARVRVHRGDVKIESIMTLYGARDSVRARVVRARYRAVIRLNEILTH